MGFIAAKIILYVITPPAGPLILMALGFLIMRFRRGLGGFLVAAGFILLYGLSIGPVSEALLKPLERGPGASKDSGVRADAIVVLGGGVRDRSWLGLPAEPSCPSLERVVTAVRLHRKLHRPLVFMGGNGDPSRVVTPDADAMARSARELGVPAGDIIVENKSRNTLEGAKSLKGLITGDAIVLVTSAYHMKRASAMFEKQGFRTLPAPAGYRYEHRTFSFYSFIPRAGYLVDSSTAISEYISLLWYSLIGAI